METSKPRNGSSEVPQRTSPAIPRTNGASELPRRASPVTPKSTHMTKTVGSKSESATSKSTTPTKIPTDRSPKVIERRSLRSPVTERKRPSRMTELESQLNQLQEDMKKTKDQLDASESWNDSHRQLMEFSAAEEAQLKELNKISLERGRAWQSDLEATQKQQSINSAASTTAMSDIHELKQQLKLVVKPEVAKAKESGIVHSQLQMLKQEMVETLSTNEELKAQLRNSEKAEAEARAMEHDTRQQLEMAKVTVETLRVDQLKLMESLNSKASELEESKGRIILLEETVKELQENEHIVYHEGVPDKNPDKNRLNTLDSEIQLLRYALEAAEIKHQEEQIQSTMQFRSTYELFERVTIDSGLREAELESALKKATAEIFELKARLIDKETELQSISYMNKILAAEMEKREMNQMESELEAKSTKMIADVAELKAKLMDKETELQSILKENELLKAEMGKREMESRNGYEASITDVELARASEKDALMRLGCITQEADKSSRRAARVSAQLDAARAVNSEMEAELRMLRVQSDQWRKAAEAAVAALTPGKNGRFMEKARSLDTEYQFVGRTSSLNTEYQSVARNLMGSPFFDNLNKESPKKKNNNMIRRISGLWKKGSK